MEFSVSYEEHRLKEIKIRVVRKTFGSKMKEVSKTGENCIMRSFTICNPYLLLLGYQMKEGGGRMCATGVTERRGAYRAYICVKT